MNTWDNTEIIVMWLFHGCYSWIKYDYTYYKRNGIQWDNDGGCKYVLTCSCGLMMGLWDYIGLLYSIHSYTMNMTEFEF